MFEKISLRTNARQELIGITDQVKGIVERSGVQEGMCYVYVPHSTAGLTINSPFDPNTWKDLVSEMDRVVPTRVDFYHTTDTPSDAAAHVKSTLSGVDAAIIITKANCCWAGHKACCLPSSMGHATANTMSKSSPTRNPR